MLFPKPEPYQKDRQRLPRVRLPFVPTVEARPVNRYNVRCFKRKRGKR